MIVSHGRTLNEANIRDLLSDEDRADDAKNEANHALLIRHFGQSGLQQVLQHHHAIIYADLSMLQP